MSCPLDSQLATVSLVNSFPEKPKNNLSFPGAKLFLTLRTSFLRVDIDLPFLRFKARLCKLFIAT